MLKYKRYNVLLCIIPNEKKKYLGGFCFIMKTKKFKLIALCGVLAMAFGAFGFTATNVSADSNVAYIDANANNQVDDGEGFATIQDAVNAAQAGDTIKLVSDIALEQSLTIANGKELTLDLAGYTISYVAENASTSAVITNKGKLVIDDSLGGGLITNKALQPDSDWNPEGFPTYANNTIANAGKLVIDGGTIENTTSGKGAYYAIDTTYASRDVSLTINGGKVICENNVAIRICTNPGTVDFGLYVNGGEIKGTRAIWIHLPGGSDARTVDADITGGKLIATGESSGHKLAIYCYSYGNSFEEVDIEISGGYVEGDIALGGGASNGGAGAETLTITDGTFDGGIYTYNENVPHKISIYGGSYNDESVKEYLVEGCTIVLNGEEYSGDFEVNGEFYTTIQNAVNEAQDGDTIKLLQDTVGAGVYIDKNITINLGGFTYTVNAAIPASEPVQQIKFALRTTSTSDGAGSAFHIASGVRVTLKNGSIAISDDVNAIISSEGNLTINGIAVDGTGANVADAAVLVSGGSTQITGNTSISVDDSSNNTTAIQVNDGAKSVTVDTTDTIGGNVNIQGNGVQTTITNGTVNGAVNVTGANSSTKIEATVNGEVRVEGNNASATIKDGAVNGNIISSDSSNVVIEGEDESIEDILMGKLPGILGGASGILGIIFGTQNTNGAMVDGGMSALTITLIVIATILAVACVAVGVLMFLDHKGLVDVKKLFIKVENWFKDLWDKIVKLFKK